MSIQDDMRICATEAKKASAVLATTSLNQRNQALSAMAEALLVHSDAILAANAKDVSAAQQAGISPSLIDRLQLNPERIHDMASALEDVVQLPDPLGKHLEERTLYNGLQLTRVSVPIGVVAVIYEARPNVTADAAGICLKSGNACILRGGSMANNSNTAIVSVLAEAAYAAGLPKYCIQGVHTTDRSATDALLSMHDLIDVIVPRGGAGLIEHCVTTSTVPVIETGTGNCHVYIHTSADPDMALRIIENAKCRRYGVCNAAETLLVDAACADEVLPKILEMFASHAVFMHLDDQAFACAKSIPNYQGSYEKATEKDWETEYLAPEIAVKCVSGLEEAIQHINTYGTGHSESIVTEDMSVADAFVNGIDAAAVYINASTAFTDGGQFGLGAEIGISTQKLHARGPFATEGLTSYKYIVRGTGQVRAQ